jgi:predicted nuclease of predicted toxin-antitoxin system
MKFLVDECLSVKLPTVAHDAGHEAYHVVHLSWGGFADWQLLRKAREMNYTFVTTNATDFKKLYSREELHTGLILLPGELKLCTQCAVFKLAIEEIASGHLINSVLEVSLEGWSNGTQLFTLTTYALPSTASARREKGAAAKINPTN